jgi:hypothetical protein
MDTAGVMKGAGNAKSFSARFHPSRGTEKTAENDCLNKKIRPSL